MTGMGKRRKARELALQRLYQIDVNGTDVPEPRSKGRPIDAETQAFAETLVQGALANQPKIDGIIAQYAEHWDLDRMAVVDRNILRVAVYELVFEPDVPPKAVINEAIEIAKKFGTRESGRFINGILDRVHKELRAAS